MAVLKTMPLSLAPRCSASFARIGISRAKHGLLIAIFSLCCLVPALADSCSSFFPNTLQAHSASSSIKFKNTGRVIDDSDNNLSFPSLIDETNSSHNTCNTIDCSVTGSSVAPLSLPSFVTTATTDDVILNGGTSTIGSGGDFGLTEIDKLTLSSAANVIFLASSTDYVISTGQFTGNAQVTFNAGVYWFDFLEILDSTQVFINGPVTIYVNQHFDIENNSQINNTGNAADLIFVGYQQIHLKNSARVNAVLYGAGQDVHIHGDAQLIGAISANGKVEIKDTATVTFADVSNVQVGDLCDALNLSVDHYEISHDSAGQTCASETVTIKACADAACSSLVNGSLSLDFQTNGSTKSSPAFTGSVDVIFDHSSAETLNLAIANPSVAPDNALVCNDGAGISCDILFSDDGCSAGSSCSVYFPQTVQAHSDSATLKFKDTGTISSNGTTQFPFVNVKDETTANHNTCTSTDCTISGTAAVALTLPNFVTTTSTTDISLSAGSSTIGSGGNFDTNEIGDLTINTDARVTFVASTSDYVITKAVFTDNAQVTFNAGVYWFDFLEILVDTQVFVNGNVTIYVNQHFDIEDNSQINVSGNAQDLVFVGYEQIHLKSSVRAKAVLYGAGQDVHLNDDAELTGAISANGTLEIKSTASVIYEDVSNTQVGELCGGLTITVDHYEIIHDGAALTCVTESVTIKACNNSDCSDLSSSPVSLDFQVDGVTKSAPTFTGSAIVGFNHSVEQNVTLSVSNTSATADNILQCDDGSSNSCAMVFASTGCDLQDCTDTFVDGITNSSDTGSVRFENTGVLIGNPDTVLASASVTNAGSAITCASANCSAGGSDSVVPALTVDFVSHNTSTNLTVNGGVQTIANNDYQTITVKGGGTLNMSASFATYTFSKLKVEAGSIVNMTAGDYFINDLEIKGASTLNVSGAGTVRIFARIKAKFKEVSIINGGISGDASKLVIYYFGEADKVKVESSASVSAYIYSVGSVEIKGSQSSVYGAISAEGEVKVKDSSFVVYRDATLTDTDFGLLCPGCDLTSFGISQPAFTLACPETRAAISLSALCEGFSVQTDYGGTVDLTAPNGSAFYAAANGGTVITNTTFNSANQGQKIVYLHFDNEDTAVKVTATDADANVISTAITGTDFRASGFRVIDQPQNFNCGDNTSMTLQAFGQSEATPGGNCEVLTGFSGDIDLDVWYRADLNNDASADDAAGTMSTGESTFTDQDSSVENNVTLTFSAGEASFNVAYNNSAKILELNFEHDDEPYDGDPFAALTASTDAFVVAPAQWGLSAITASTTLNNTSSSGTAIVAAGRPFTLAISAQCSDASTATDYQPNATANTLVAYAQRTGPTSGDSEGQLKIADAADLVTTISATPAWASTNIAAVGFDNGFFTYLEASYSEVGLVRLYLKDQNYYGINTNFSTLDIGRFIPDHFSVAPSNGSFQDACNNSFTYSGQTFTYNATPSLAITAQNFADATTGNYTEPGYQRLLVGGVSLSYASQDNSQDGSDGSTKLNVTASVAGGTLSVISAGVLSYDFGADQFVYNKNINALVAPFASDYVITINDISEPSGADGVSTSGLPSSLTPSGVLVRYGRFRIENVFGPETHPLALFSQAEFFNNNGFEVNTLDVCTNISGNITINSGTDFSEISVGAGSSDFSFSGPLVSGDAGFSFTAPGSGNQGNIDVSVDISALPWLFFDWDADGDLEQHDGVTATFGLYRGHDKIIYWREVTN